MQVMPGGVRLFQRDDLGVVKVVVVMCALAEDGL
jgi:hypothetical protein